MVQQQIIDAFCFISPSLVLRQVYYVWGLSRLSLIAMIVGLFFLSKTLLYCCTQLLHSIISSALGYHESLERSGKVFAL